MTPRRQAAWWIWWGLPVVGVGAWVVWVVTQLVARPVMVDEAFYAYAARGPIGEFSHAPLYPRLLRLLYTVCHASPRLLRLLGVGTFVGAAGIAYRLAERWEPRGGRWALGLLLTSPLLLHGAALLDIDNTVLTWWTVTSVWWLARMAWPPRWPTLLGLGCWWTLGLGMKLTTPLLWPVALWLAYVSRGMGRRGLRDVALMSAVGAATFLGLWTWYASVLHLPWDLLFSGRTWEMLRRGPTDMGTTILRELVERAGRIGLWLGPLALMCWCWANAQVWRARQQLRYREAWVAALVMGWGILVGYWVIGGVIWSFAKYHVPFVPLLAAVCGATLAHLTQATRLPRLAYLAIISGVVVAVITLVGDPLYLVNHTVRAALLVAPAEVPSHLMALMGRMGWLVAVVGLMACVLWWRRDRWQVGGRALVGLALGLGTIGSGVGTLLLQVAAPYSTSYTYGRPFATYAAEQRCALRIYAADPTAQLMVPFDTIQVALPNEDYRRVSVGEGHYISTPDAMIAALRNPRLALVVMDPDFSAVHAIRDVWRHPGVRDILARNFVHVSLGTADGWVRTTYADAAGAW